jgi:transcriptional regulator with XRE-family HTH domain
MPSDLALRMRQTRETLGISLPEAERITKIRRKYLEAIEAGDFAQLPDGPPSRGFIKNYARFLGLDPERSLSDFEAEVGVPVLQLKDPVPPMPPRTRAVSKLTQTTMPDLKWRGAMPDDGSADLDTLAEGRAVAAGNEATLRDGSTGRAMVIQPEKRLRASGSVFRLKKSKGPFEEYDPNLMTSRGPRQPFASLQKPAWQKALPYVFGGIAALALMLFAGSVILPRVGEALGSIELPSLAAAPEQVAAQATTPASGQPQISITFVAPQPAQVEGQTAPETIPTAAPAIIGTAVPIPTVAPLAGGGVQLALDARERAWVRVRVDGNVVYEGIPPIGPGTPYNAGENVQLETGNAGAFDVILNGTRLGPLGARNETITKTYGAGQ